MGIYQTVPLKSSKSFYKCSCGRRPAVQRKTVLVWAILIFRQHFTNIVLTSQNDSDSIKPTLWGIHLSVFQFLGWTSGQEIVQLYLLPSKRALSQGTCFLSLILIQDFSYENKNKCLNIYTYACICTCTQDMCTHIHTFLHMKWVYYIKYIKTAFIEI